ncbi:MAG: adenosylmethionine decarboxylase [Gammaproteobacteria bacterium]|nr:adenosylmethionine decarboxylase [Gammaproteobacteria bacterium]
MSRTTPKLKLEGFNNLSKTLSLSFYDFGYASDREQQRAWYLQVEKKYNAQSLGELFGECAEKIGAEILSIACQDYDPQGASVALMIAEEPIFRASPDKPVVSGSLSRNFLIHLDKSHITAHTYPEHHPDNGVCSCRIDVEISTCGHISPLKLLNPLVSRFDCAVVSLDYRVRGFTRNQAGGKCFQDYPVDSIQDVISPPLKARYRGMDLNLHRANLLHTRLMSRDVDWKRCQYGNPGEVSTGEQQRITGLLQREMLEIYLGGQEMEAGNEPFVSQMPEST